MPQCVAQVGSGNHPRRGARLYHEDRFLAGYAEGEDATAALHHQQFGRHSLLAQSGFDAL